MALIRMAGEIGLPFSLKCVAACSVAVLLAACQSGSEAPSRQVKSPEQLQALSEPYKGRAVTELVSDAGAVGVAQELYTANCASCHGANGRGGRGVMDLVGGHFNYGTSAEAIHTTISQGRKTDMPSMKESNLGAVDIGQLVAYVQSLSKDKDKDGPSLYEQRGQQLFKMHCASCHGDDGHGNFATGAPNLADDYWLNGSSMMNIRLLVTGGEESECPAFGGKLNPTEIDLLTAYVLKLMQPQPGGSG
ncbi:MAG TPA: c-type cytochrome [Gammaproteobacteria bacterium]|nr:c-type cytochrome [Gammaproteobacteria bacterium]